MDHLVNEIQIGNCVNDMPTSSTMSMNNDAGVNDELIVSTEYKVVTHIGNIFRAGEEAIVQGCASEPCSTFESCVLTHLLSGIQVSGIDTATLHLKSTIN